ncbi:DUF5675 family protein [Chitinimonas sp. PSY-7]|uniref:DUF5675 family protein n=1 Tax=Chitinimonas sp. PSY-7 TaxID=3459088 RepID=UPI0040403C27
MSSLTSPQANSQVRRYVVLTRRPSSDDGTFGSLQTNNGFTCKTLELPWRDNRTNRSCIPPGDYLCKVVLSPHLGQVYGLLNVPGRTDILIHAGNFAGDVEKGLKSDVEGCILLGESDGVLDGQRAVLNSRSTVTRFMQAMDYAPLVLSIRQMAR